MFPSFATNRLSLRTENRDGKFRVDRVPHDLNLFAWKSSYTAASIMVFMIEPLEREIDLVMMNNKTRVIRVL